MHFPILVVVFLVCVLLFVVVVVVVNFTYQHFYRLYTGDRGGH